MSTDNELIQTPRYEAILNSATNISRAMSHDHIGVEHVFLAIIRDCNALPTQVLTDFADITQLDSRLRGIMESPGYNASRQTSFPPHGEAGENKK